MSTTTLPLRKEGRAIAVIIGIIAILLSVLPFPGNSSKAHATTTHTISGTVTLGAGANPTWMQQVYVYAQSNAGNFQSAMPDATTGMYSITVPADTYTLNFTTSGNSAPNLVNKTYPSPVDATTSDPTGINVTMQVGGSISGTITMPPGSTGGSMAVLDGNGNWAGGTSSTDSGSFSIARLSTGSYHLGLWLNSGGFQYLTSGGSSTFAVVQGQDTSGLLISAQPANASISGSIGGFGFTAPATPVPAPLYLGDTNLYQKLDGAWTKVPEMFPTAPGLTTTAAGFSQAQTAFSMPGLAAGTYTVGFEASGTPYSNNGPVTSQWWQNKGSLATSDPITLNTGQAVTGICGSVHPSNVMFADVPADYQFNGDITWMANQGITTGYDLGCGSREFRPWGSVTRDAMAAFLYRYAGSPAWTAPTTSPFTDVTPQSPFYKEITWLANSGVTTGWSTASGKEFRPSLPITRDAMAAFLYRFDKSPAFTPPTTSPFVDVSTTNGFYKEITWLAQNGITTGWTTSSGQEFRPFNNIARDAMAAFLHRYKLKFG